MKTINDQYYAMCYHVPETMFIKRGSESRNLSVQSSALVFYEGSFWIRDGTQERKGEAFC